eukprot:TRINITY_DN4535_c0_g1_i1.p1 TRINITY_DN4535_c0_g1~~TRINITY_DN4535_c0_g1_i1.p1  ORF type:complete len:223 (-),score=46.23 TRINITY_DN4535_c0_g1_i1:136-804(-)
MASVQTAETGSSDPRSNDQRIVTEQRSNAESRGRVGITIPIALQVCPSEGFGIVEEGVYRSNALMPMNFRFFQSLNLKTVLRLSPERPLKVVASFYEDQGINQIHLGLKAWQPTAAWKPVTDELVKEALEIVLDRNYHPLLVVCTSGIYQTGTLVGCLRRLQHWNITSIIQEYRSYAGGNAKYLNEQFIELFDVDLVTLPRDLPHWFIEQQKMMAEEEEEWK